MTNLLKQARIDQAKVVCHSTSSCSQERNLYFASDIARLNSTNAGMGVGSTP
jgi:hypothetical protein